MKVLPADERDRSRHDPEVRAKLTEYMDALCRSVGVIPPARPIPPPSIVAIGRLTADEREELIGLRAKVKRQAADMRQADERGKANRRSADFWRDLTLVLVVVAFLSHVVR